MWQAISLSQVYSSLPFFSRCSNTAGLHQQWISSSSCAHLALSFYSIPDLFIPDLPMCFTSENSRLVASLQTFAYIGKDVLLLGPGWNKAMFCYNILSKPSQKHKLTRASNIKFQWKKSAIREMKMLLWHIMCPSIIGTYRNTERATFHFPLESWHLCEICE